MNTSKSDLPSSSTSSMRKDEYPKTGSNKPSGKPQDLSVSAWIVGMGSAIKKMNQDATFLSEVQKQQS